MIVFVAIGSLILAGTALKNRFYDLSGNRGVFSASASPPAPRGLFYTFFSLIALLKKSGLSMPLFPVESIADAWGRIPAYLPVFALEMAGLVFLLKCGNTVRKGFQARRARTS
jgi:hypothetical protein